MKRKTKAERERLAFKQSQPVGIGETREEQKDREDLREHEIITAVRRYIWRTRPVCQLCYGKRASRLPDQMHEDPSRAHTRGKPPEERFNLLVCGRLCALCHADVTEGRLRIVFEKPTLGFLGPVRAESPAGGKEGGCQ
jgi:hypothetical protein